MTDTIITFTTEEADAGLRVDQFLAAHHDGHSRSFFQTLCKDGSVEINGKKVKASRLLKADEVIKAKLPLPEEPDIEAQPIPLSILYEDDDVLIVDKPKGMVVHPAPGHSKDTLVNAVMHHCKDSLSGINGVLRPGIVHRIDKDTSGSLIICKNDHAHRAIAALLKTHSITRVYRGIVTGHLPDDKGVIEGNIGRDPKERKKMAVLKDKGKPAVTMYRVLERLNGYDLAEFTLKTGRTHQIRVHMSYIHHPLLGDTVYGPKKQPFPLEGQTLHAYKIGFIHPTTGEYMEFTAPVPDYFEDLLNKLRR